MGDLTTRRLLVLGQPGSGILSFLQELTGSTPSLPAPAPPAATTSQQQQSVAGLSHTWHLKTAYYDVTIPVWIDEIGQVEDSKKDDESHGDFLAAVSYWQREFLKDEAKEVLDVLGAIVFGFEKPAGEEDLNRIKACLRAISTVRDEGCGPEWEGMVLAVGNVPSPSASTATMAKTVPQRHPTSVSTFDEWDEMTMNEFGCEYIDFEMKGRNEYGELSGMARVQEALSTINWSAGGVTTASGTSGTDNLSDHERPEAQTRLIEQEVENLERELFGLSQPMLHPASDRDLLTKHKDNNPTTSNDNGTVDGQATQPNYEGHDEESTQKDQIDSLERMMSKLQAVRERRSELAGSGAAGTEASERSREGGKEKGQSMSELERRRDALRLVRELMQDF